MSKYTTEVRFICEKLAGYAESQGASKVDEVLSKCWDKVITSKVEFFDEKYRETLYKKVLKHYYLREIGCESVGVWQLWVNERFEMIMPYYNQLYKSSLLEFEPLQDVNVTTKSKRDVRGSSEENGESSSSSKDSRDVTGMRDTSSSSKSEGVSRDLYSDTPQGSLSRVEDSTYLTNARKVSDSDSGSSNEGVTYSEGTNASGSVNGTTSNVGSTNSIDEYVESVIGKRGGESYSKMLVDFRNTLLNIDAQVVDEFSDLFMGLW